MCIHSDRGNHYETRSSSIHFSSFHPRSGQPSGMERSVNDKRGFLGSKSAQTVCGRIDWPRLSPKQGTSKKSFGASLRRQQRFQTMSWSLSTMALLFLLHVVSAGSITKLSDVAEKTAAIGNESFPQTKRIDVAELPMPLEAISDIDISKPSSSDRRLLETPLLNLTDCHEDEEASFFLRLKKDGSSIPIFQTCSWLYLRDQKQIICDTNTTSWDDGSSIIGPAREVCKYTCGTCYLTHPSAAPSTSLAPSRFPSGKPKSRSHISNSFLIVQPSDLLSVSPTSSSSMRPSMRPTSLPSVPPSEVLSVSPTSSSTAPSTSPSISLSEKPSNMPSFMPTGDPSAVSSSSPSTFPTPKPTKIPSISPTSLPSTEPSADPTNFPTSPPSNLPTSQPSAHPTYIPSGMPSMTLSLLPTSSPTSRPSYSPTRSPSLRPTGVPSFSPSHQPSAIPSPSPTNEPSTSPTSTPTSLPSASPTSSPTASPSLSPSSFPTVSPTLSLQPSVFPTAQPTSSPTTSPTSVPTKIPSHQPSAYPSQSPSAIPSYSLQELEFFLVFQFDDLTEIPGKAIVELETLTEKIVEDALKSVYDDNFKVWADVTSQAAFDFESETSKKLDERRRLQAIGLEVGVEVFVEVRSGTTFEKDETRDVIAEAFDTEGERRAFFNELQVADSSFRRINAMEITINNERVELKQPGGSSWVYIGSGIGVGVVTITAFLYFNSRRRRREENFRNVEIPDDPPNVDARLATMIEVDPEPGDMSTLGDPVYGGPTGMFSAAATAFVQHDDPSSESNELSAYDYKMAYGGTGDMPSVASAEVKSTTGTQALGSRVQSLDSSKVSKVSDNPDALSVFDDDDSFEKMYGEEEIIEIDAPAGKLGVVIDNPIHGAPMVHAIKETSVLSNFIRIGDKLISVDGEDTTEMSAIQVSKLISSKSMNPRRRMVFLRPAAPY